MPTAPPDLTETTVRYLFAATWLSEAVASDCLPTVIDAYSRDGGDKL